VTRGIRPTAVAAPSVTGIPMRGENATNQRRLRLRGKTGRNQGGPDPKVGAVPVC